MITFSRVQTIVERNALAYGRRWPLFLVGFFEPLLFLLSIGIGVGALVDEVLGPGGRLVEYEKFVAPGMLAMAAMNASVLDTTFNFFVKYKYLGTYDTMLATPLTVTELSLGEVLFGQLKSAIYGGAFLLTMVGMGLVESWWAVLALPVVVLIGFAFAGVGLASTTFMRSFVDFDYVNLVLAPLFLLSATFFPVERYPAAIEAIVRVTPLYQGVVLEQALILGVVEWSLLANAAYLLLMGAAGLWVAVRRLRPLLQP